MRSRGSRTQCLRVARKRPKFAVCYTLKRLGGAEGKSEHATRPTAAPQSSQRNCSTRQAASQLALHTVAPWAEHLTASYYISAFSPSGHRWVPSKTSLTPHTGPSRVCRIYPQAHSTGRGGVVRSCRALVQVSGASAVAASARGTLRLAAPQYRSSTVEVVT